VQCDPRVHFTSEGTRVLLKSGGACKSESGGDRYNLFVFYSDLSEAVVSNCDRGVCASYKAPKYRAMAALSMWTATCRACKTLSRALSDPHLSV